MHDGVAVLTEDSRDAGWQGVAQALEAAQGRPKIRATVIACATGVTAAGPASAFPALLEGIEASDKPVVAALSGTVLGAEFEFALACHGRVAADSARNVGDETAYVMVVYGAANVNRTFAATGETVGIGSEGDRFIG